jgi:hypothetical protein
VGVGVGIGVGVGVGVGATVGVGEGDGRCGLLWGITIVAVGAASIGMIGTISPRTAIAVAARLIIKITGANAFLIRRTSLASRVLLDYTTEC